MMAAPNAISHGLTTGGGAFTSFFLSKSAATPETVEQPSTSAAAHTSFFMIPHSPKSDLLNFGSFDPAIEEPRPSCGCRPFPSEVCAITSENRRFRQDEKIDSCDTFLGNYHII